MGSKRIDNLGCVKKYQGNHKNKRENRSNKHKNIHTGDRNLFPPSQENRTNNYEDIHTGDGNLLSASQESKTNTWRRPKRF